MFSFNSTQKIILDEEKILRHSPFNDLVKLLKGIFESKLSSRDPIIKNLNKWEDMEDGVPFIRLDLYYKARNTSKTNQHKRFAIDKNFLLLLKRYNPLLEALNLFNKFCNLILNGVKKETNLKTPSLWEFINEDPNVENVRKGHLDEKSPAALLN